ncbi:MAG: amidophosphoribosyltransferase [Candidatus Altiarchaeota archaeon]
MRDKCAVFGIMSDEPVYSRIYLGLYALQHRGQESAGMATFHKGKVRAYKNMGLVSEVFREIDLEGNVGIGHVRYSTTGESRLQNAQPLLINYAMGSFAIAHNGNIVNSFELKTRLEHRGNIFSTTSDTEVIAHIIAREHIQCGDLVEAIKKTMRYLEGAYCLTILSGDKLIAVRDPHGIRPLVYGYKAGTHVFASESCALDAIQVPLVRDVKPSEILVLEKGKLSSHFGLKDEVKHCMFEYVYFARPDSVINGRSVFEVRKKLGWNLYHEATAKLPDIDADIVIPVPNSGITTAIGYSEESGIYYSEGLMKNTYVGRTFILPEQGMRDFNVRLKMNPITSEIKGKEVILVDDSIVRGTTQKRLVKLLKDAGAEKVHVRIACPPIKHPCFYGIDMQTKGEFIASKKTVNQIRKKIGADSLHYTSIEGLVESIGFPKEKLCVACLTGQYPIKKKQTKLID